MGLVFPHSGIELTADGAGSGWVLEFGEQNEKTGIHHNDSGFCRGVDARPGGIGQG